MKTTFLKIVRFKQLVSLLFMVQFFFPWGSSIYAQATGGTVTLNGTTVKHTFSVNSTFQTNSYPLLNMQILVVGGGGPGEVAANPVGSGGGAGGVMLFPSSGTYTKSLASGSGQSWTITIGSGGSSTVPSSGGNSSVQFNNSSGDTILIALGGNTAGTSGGIYNTSSTVAGPPVQVSTTGSYVAGSKSTGNPKIGGGGGGSNSDGVSGSTSGAGGSGVLFDGTTYAVGGIGEGSNSTQSITPGSGGAGLASGTSTGVGGAVVIVYDAVPVWRGTVDNSWSNSANWVNGYIPSSGIPYLFIEGTTNHPTLPSNFTVTNKLSIVTGAQLNVPSGVILTLSGVNNVINGQLNLAGTISLSGTGSITYGTSSNLNYNGSSIQTVGDEWVPFVFSSGSTSTGFVPGSITVSNSAGLKLKSSLTLTSTYYANAYQFKTTGNVNLSSGDLTLNGASLILGSISSSSSNTVIGDTVANMGFTSASAGTLFMDQTSSSFNSYLDSLSLADGVDLTLGNRLSFCSARPNSSGDVVLGQTASSGSNLNSNTTPGNKNDALLNLECDYLGYPSIVNIKNDGTITGEIYSTHYISSSTGYFSIGTVVDSTINFDWQYMDDATSNACYTWDPTVNGSGWTSVKSSTLTRGTGIFCFRSGGGNVTLGLEGSGNFGSFSKTATLNNSSSDPGWNLFCNPYLNYLDFSAFLSGSNNSTLKSGTGFSIWNRTNSNYDKVSKSGNDWVLNGTATVVDPAIEPGTAFWVEVGSTGSLTFAPSQTTNSASTSVKGNRLDITPESERAIVTLKFGKSTDNLNDAASLVAHSSFEGNNLDFEIGWDGSDRIGNCNDIGILTKTEECGLKITQLESSSVHPLRVKVCKAGDYIFDFTTRFEYPSVINPDVNHQFYFIDQIAGSRILIKNGDQISVNIDKTSNDRFFIEHYFIPESIDNDSGSFEIDSNNSTVLSAENKIDLSKESLQMMPNPGRLNDLFRLNNYNHLYWSDLARVYDFSGKEIMECPITESGNLKFSSGYMSSGFYILKVSSKFGPQQDAILKFNLID